MQKTRILSVACAFAMVFATAVQPAEAKADLPQPASSVLLAAQESAKAAEETETVSTGTESSGLRMTKEEITFYLGALDEESTTKTTLYFKDGNRQLPYLDLKTVRELMVMVNSYSIGCPPEAKPYDLKLETDGPKAVLTRENTYWVEFDFDKDSIRFLDYDMFMTKSYKGTVMDLLSASGYDTDGKPSIFQRVKKNSYDRYGTVMTLDLSAYGIDLIYEDGNYYLPLQTVADVLFPNLYLLYNTKELFFMNSAEAQTHRTTPSKMLERYYAVSVGKRSKELIDYTYNELCFVLDAFYGLKESHEITTFDDLFTRLEINGTSMKEMLHSEDPAAYEKALAQLTFRDLDDNHSGYYLPGVFAGESVNPGNEITMGISNRAIAQQYVNFVTERSLQYPGGVPGYEEVGNTAYVTFDNFTYTSSIDDLYQNFPTAGTNDTISLLIYAHSQIMRENSPIENVVIDLSCNTGGVANSAIFTCAWFQGETSLYVENPSTGAAACTAYRCDVNLDRKFDEKDTLQGKNLYCLISPVSFSCGNLVPNVFASSHNVTLIGQTSGGGSCCVLPLTSASGSMFQVSSSNVISVIKNGAYYDVDQGATPDVVLTKTKSFYDRVSLTTMINNLP